MAPLTKDHLSISNFEMKKFIPRITLMFSLLTGLCLIVIEVVSWHNPFERHIEQVLDNSSSISVLNIGNSSCLAVDFKNTNRTGAQLWTSGQDLYETKFILQNTVPMLPHLEYVLLAINCVSFADFKFYLEKRAGVYYRFPNAGPMEGDYKNYIKSKGLFLNQMPGYFPKILWNNLNIEAGSMTCQETYNAAVGHGWATIDFMKKASFDGLADSTISKEMKRRAGKYQEWIGKAKGVRPNLLADGKQELEDIIYYLQKNNIKIVLYTPPSYPEFVSLLPDSLIAQTEQMTTDLAKEHNIPYYNFLRSDLYVNDKSLFLNQDHLNAKGAFKFSSMLFESLKIK